MEIESIHPACNTRSPPRNMRPLKEWNLGESNSTHRPCEGQSPPWYMRPHEKSSGMSICCQASRARHLWNPRKSNPTHRPCRGQSPPWNMGPRMSVRSIKKPGCFCCNRVPINQPNLKGLLPVQPLRLIGATIITFCCGSKTVRTEVLM